MWFFAGATETWLLPSRSTKSPLARTRRPRTRWAALWDAARDMVAEDVDMVDEVEKIGNEMAR